MLPVVTEEMKQQIFEEVGDDIHSWRKKMIHILKEENPEINATIIQAASITSLDPKAIATGAYLIYKLLEIAQTAQDAIADQIVFEE